MLSHKIMSPNKYFCWVTTFFVKQQHFFVERQKIFCRSSLINASIMTLQSLRKPYFSKVEYLHVYSGFWVNISWKEWTYISFHMFLCYLFDFRKNVYILYQNISVFICNHRIIFMFSENLVEFYMYVDIFLSCLIII